MKCLNCGNKAIIDNQCRKCFLDSYNNVLGFKKFNLSICIMCGSYCYGSQFRPAIEFDTALKKAIMANTKFERKPKDVIVGIILPKHTKKKGTKINAIADIVVTTEIGKGEDKIVKKEEYQLPIKMKYSMCDKCSRVGTHYFEGRIQLRNDKSEEFKKVAKYIKERIDGRDHVFITTEENVKNGTDYYVTSQKFIQTVGNELSKRFGGELKVTSSLHTKDWQTSKDLFRVDVLFRLADFNVGDIIEINNKLLLVKTISGKMVSGLDLKSKNKQTNENYTNKEYEIIATRKEYKHAEVVRHKPTLEVLHPETYQSTSVENPKEVKEKVNVVIIDGKVYVV